MKDEYKDYLGLVAQTPMRRLRKLCNRDDVDVYGKLEGTNLGGSVKDRAALAMIGAAEKAGVLDDGQSWSKRQREYRYCPRYDRGAEKAADRPATGQCNARTAGDYESVWSGSYPG